MRSRKPKKRILDWQPTDFVLLSCWLSGDPTDKTTKQQCRRCRATKTNGQINIAPIPAMCPPTTPTGTTAISSNHQPKPPRKINNKQTRKRSNSLTNFVFEEPVTFCLRFLAPKPGNAATVVARGGRRSSTWIGWEQDSLNDWSVFPHWETIVKNADDAII